MSEGSTAMDDAPKLNTVAFEKIASHFVSMLQQIPKDITTLSQLVNGKSMEERGIAYFIQEIDDHKKAQKQIRCFQQWFITNFAPPDHHGWGERLPKREGTAE
jgi:hypothetical protein